MANNRMPGKGGPRGFAGGQKVDGKAFARLMRMLFHDYPGKLTAVVICITLKTGIPYNEGCFEEWCKHSKRKRADHMINELQRLGYTVVVPE